ncbi:MAG: c-type cytochrome biogenesis protein CcsB [Geodermatophilaceae bacterium]
MAVNDSLAALADTAFTGSVVVYSVAVVGFAGEYAFGRRGRVARTSLEQTSTAVGGSDRAGTVTGTATGSGQRLGAIGLACTVIGAALQVLSLVFRGVATDRVPWGNMFEFACAAVLVTVLSFLWLVRQAPALRHIGVFVLIPALFVLVYAGLILYAEAEPLVAALRSYWLAIHVAAAITATGIFMLSFVVTVLYLIRQRYERGVIEDGAMPRAIAGLGPRLPTAAVLDRLSYRTVAFAFPIWTFAVIAGAIWAESAWGRFWGWDPKETWALIAWLVYACYLHARATAGWKGVKAARINLLGFFAMTFNFLIVNMVVSGLHSYSGLT